MDNVMVSGAKEVSKLNAQGLSVTAIEPLTI